MKLDEDPWDNYLFHDSKHLLPLICHNEALPIEKQVLLARFIEYSITPPTLTPPNVIWEDSMREETISQYTINGQALSEEFLSFVSNFENNLDLDDDDEEAESSTGNNLLIRIGEACKCDNKMP